METNQAEQLNAFLNQSAKVLNKNKEAEETDASTILKRNKRSPSPLDTETL